MSGMDVPMVDHNGTGLPADNGTFLRFSPTSASTSAAASSPGRPGNVYVYVWLFLGLLVFLLTLLIDHIPAQAEKHHRLLVPCPGLWQRGGQLIY